MAALSKKPLKSFCVKTHVPMYVNLVNIPQDYNGGFFGNNLSKALSLFGDPPKSSVPESGEARFKCPSSSNGKAYSNKDRVKDPDLEQTAFNAA